MEGFEEFEGWGRCEELGKLRKGCGALKWLEGVVGKCWRELRQVAVVRESCG